jgi:chromosome condensin MukBEF MukE localization factor
MEASKRLEHVEKQRKGNQKKKNKKESKARASMARVSFSGMIITYLRDSPSIRKRGGGWGVVEMDLASHGFAC